MSDKYCRDRAEQCMRRARAFERDSKSSSGLYNYNQAVRWYLEIEYPTAEDYRGIAEAYEGCVETCNNLSDKPHYYTKAVECYLQIQLLTANDHRAIADIYRSVAIFNFNRRDKPTAADYFWRAKEQLLQIKLDEREDRDYRELTLTFLDLVDTCYYLHNQQAVDEAKENAFQAFDCIKTKNSKELDFGDPRSVVGFPKFFEYFQEQSAKPSYLSSAEYKNHAHIVQATHAKRMDEQSMADLFGGICIDEVNKGLGEMMNALAINNVSKPSVAAIPSFAPINLERPSNDVAFRTLAIDFLGQTQVHIQQSKISDTIATYKEALQALEKVQDKSELDQQIITAIGRQISYLKEQIEKFKVNSVKFDDDKSYDGDAAALDEEQPKSESLPLQNQQVANS